MPYFWTQIDTRKAIISSFLPTSVFLGGAISLSKNGNKSFIEV